MPPELAAKSRYDTMEEFNVDSKASVFSLI